MLCSCCSGSSHRAKASRCSSRWSMEGIALTSSRYPLGPGPGYSSAALFTVCWPYRLTPAHRTKQPVADLIQTTSAAAGRATSRRRAQSGGRRSRGPIHPLPPGSARARPLRLPRAARRARREARSSFAFERAALVALNVISTMNPALEKLLAK